jgi:hypothetical protein
VNRFAIGSSTKQESWQQFRTCSNLCLSSVSTESAEVEVDTLYLDINHKSQVELSFTIQKSMYFQNLLLSLFTCC